MVVIITSVVTERLRYICDLIFNEQLGVAYEFETDLQQTHQGKTIIHYHHQPCSDISTQMQPHGLLMETGIRPQAIEMITFQSFSEPGACIQAFFKTSEEGFPFDIFAASFFLLSRYEEYITTEKDAYGRFPHEASVAYQHGFLSLPLINSWIQELSAWLRKQNPHMELTPRKFEAMLTYDIDMAWSYLYKGLWRNIAAWLRHPTMERLKVNMRKATDPFDCFDYLTESQLKLNRPNQLFFLMAANRSRYDKNIAPVHPAMVNLIQRLSSVFSIGLHPSWSSYHQAEIIQQEKKHLEAAISNSVTASRQHYIRMQLPETYRLLLQAGIQKDYSMGYGSINGFRASFAGSFCWYDLEKEEKTGLRIYPFCFMDANSRFEQHQDAATSVKELESYFNLCKKYNGLFISIFHNHLIGNDKEGLNWRIVHEQLISLIQQSPALHHDA